MKIIFKDGGFLVNGFPVQSIFFSHFHENQRLFANDAVNYDKHQYEDKLNMGKQLFRQIDSSIERIETSGKIKKSFCVGFIRGQIFSLIFPYFDRLF